MKTTTCAPPPTMPVTDSTSSPGVSMTVRPLRVIGAAYGTTSASGVRSPPLCVAPSDFSSIVVRPPRMLPGRRLGAADVEAERHRFRLDPVDDAEQTRRGVGGRRARREQVLRAHDLGDLAEHRRAAEHRPADRRPARAPDSTPAPTCSRSRRTSPTASATTRRTARAARCASVRRSSRAISRRLARSCGPCRLHSESRRSAPACRRDARSRPDAARRPARSRAR